jgi:hypothetical protein
VNSPPPHPRRDVGTRLAGVFVTITILRGALVLGYRVFTGGLILRARDIVFLVSLVPHLAVLLYAAVSLALVGHLPRVLTASRKPLQSLMGWVLAETLFCVSCISYDFVVHPTRFSPAVGLVLIWTVTLVVTVLAWRALHSVVEKCWPRGKPDVLSNV